jgi:hypothetical protein
MSRPSAAGFGILERRAGVPQGWIWRPHGRTSRPDLAFSRSVRSPLGEPRWGCLSGGTGMFPASQRGCRRAGARHRALLQELRAVAAMTRRSAPGCAVLHGGAWWLTGLLAQRRHAL